MRLAVAALLTPALSIAQPGVAPIVEEPPPTTSPEVLGLARGAHAAGVRGDCVGARTLSARIATLDPEFHAAVIATDLSITQCTPKPRVLVVPDEGPTRSDTVAPRSTRATISGGMIAAQFLLGGAMGLGLGIAGVYVGDMKEVEYAMIGGGLGVVAGTTAGVAIVGENDGSVALAAIGSTFGIVIGGMLLVHNNSESAPLTFTLLVMTPTLGAMLGYHVSRSTASRTDSTPRTVPAAPRISDSTSFSLLGGTF